MPHGRAAAGTSLSDEVRSAFNVLGDDEHRRWQDSCQALEGAHEYAWAEPESRALVAGVLACLFGEDLTRLDVPARDWARTNTTMAVFTRRLGCLRELIGQEGVLNGPDATMRAHQVFDRVTIVGTESALAALTYPGVAPAAATPVERESADEPAAPLPSMAVESLPSAEIVGAAPSSVDEPVATSEAAVGHEAELDEDAGVSENGSRIRRRTLVVLLVFAVAALGAALVFTLASGSGPHGPRHRGGGVHGVTTATTSAGTTPAPGRGGAGPGSAAPPQGGAGSPGNPGSGTATGPTSPSAPGTGGAGGGSGGSGDPGSSTGTTLPGGTPVTAPQVTVPQATVPGLPIPGVTVPGT